MGLQLDDNGNSKIDQEEKEATNIQLGDRNQTSSTIEKKIEGLRKRK